MLLPTLLLCLGAAVTPSTLADAAAASSVTILSDGNFTEAFPPTGASNAKLVFFFAPWCGHCAKFSPVFEEYASSRRADAQFVDEIGVDFFMVDATSPESEMLASTYDVVSFPTLLYFPASTATAVSPPPPVPYTEDDKISTSLDAFLQRRRLGDDLLPVTTQASYDFVLEIPGSDLVVTLKGDGGDGRSAELLTSVYLEIQADELTKPLRPVFAHVLDGESELGPTCPAKGQTCVEVYNRQGDGSKVVRPMSDFTSLRDPSSALASFIVLHGTSVLQKYRQGMFGRSQTGSIIKKFVVLFQREYHMSELRTSSFNAAIPSFRDNEIATVWVDPLENREFAEMYKIMGPDDEGDARWKNLPSVLLIDVSGKQGSQVTKVLGPDELSTESLVKNAFHCMSDDKKDEELCDAKPRARSDLARKSYMELIPIKKLVGKTIKRRILTSKKDQFVFFFNQGDQLWKPYREQFNAICSRFHMQDSLEFYEFDTSANDIPLKFLELKSTPALYFFPAHAKGRPVRFGGEGKVFKVDDLLEWFSGVVTIPFKGELDERRYVSFAGRVRYQIRMAREMGFWNWLRTAARWGKDEPKLVEATEL